MGGYRHIKFRGQTYRGYEALTAAWNARQPDSRHAKPRNVAQSIQKWRKSNPGKELTDEVIENFLITRAAKHGIKYKDEYFNGPADLFRTLEEFAEVSYKAFFLKLSTWQTEHPDAEPDDCEIEKFIKATRFEASDGRRVGRDRLAWERAPQPKASWSMVARKISLFKRRHGRLPTDTEISELSRPEREWMQSSDCDKYRDTEGRQLTMEEFFGLFNFDKVHISTSKARVRRFRNRVERLPTAEDAIKLMHPWGVVDRAFGILYRWRNKVNGRTYIGVTTETLEERTRGHLRTVEKGDLHPLGLHRAIEEFGLEAFEVEEIARFESLEELADAERREITRHDCLAPNGYNLTGGGKGLATHALPLSFRGKNYKNWAALAQDYGISLKRLASRLRLGWSIDEAVKIPKGMQRNKQYQQLTERPISQLALERNMEPSKVYDRIKNCGWTLDEALGDIARPQVGGKAKRVIVAGIEFPSHRRAAKHFGISEGTWHKRVKLGWTLEQAAGLEARPSVSDRHEIE